MSQINNGIPYVGVNFTNYTFPAVSISYLNFANATMVNTNLGSVTEAIYVNFNGANLTGTTL